MPPLVRHLMFTCSVMALACASPSLLHANPLDGSVAAGSASIVTNGKNLDITQQSDKVVIDWRGFDIAPDESTNFLQPGSGSIALNRVNSTSASSIEGKLTANGNVFIVNQNGVMFGAGAQVDVNGLVVSTADIDNNNFMNGKLVFDKAGKADAKIINKGTITAKDAGLVGFVAPNVENSGVIVANLGRVHLASGDKATVDLYGDGLMEVEVSDDVTSQVVKNTGTIQANGGKIALTASAGKNIVNSLIQVEGLLKAQSVGVKNGEIIIGAAGSNKTSKSGKSRVVINGTLDASGKATGQTGGKITVTGDDITLSSTSRLDASGHAGGGSIKLGGDYQGKGTTQTAKTLTVEQGSLITNDAIETGNGGTTILWSDGDTIFRGLITARGGSINGNGGFAEVSGKGTLLFSGLVNLLADKGETGTLLLDPTDITISSAADSNTTGTSSVTGTAATSNINVTTLQNQLALSAVTISTTSAYGGNGDITILSAITWANNGKSLTLTADRDININATISSGSGTNNFTATAGRDINVNAAVSTLGSGSAATYTATRDIFFNANVSLSGSGALTATAGRNLTVASGVTLTSGATGAMSLLAANNMSWTQGRLTLNGNLNMGTGALQLVSGTDTSGVRGDLTLNNTNLLMQGATFGVVTLTGFRDTTIDRDIISTAGITIDSGRNITIATGRTITTAAGWNLYLNAAGNNVNGTGIFTLNGTINATNGQLQIISGLDGSGNRADLTLNSTNFLMSGATLNTTTISGFNDITLNRNLAFSNTATITANRNLTIGSGATITSGTSAALSLLAAGGATGNIGLLTLNGNLSMGTGALTLVSGVDASSNRGDLTLNSTNFLMQGATIAAPSITGFRDITINRNITSSGTLSLTAFRNLTVGSGVTLRAGSSGALSLYAANNVAGALGILTMNGILNLGTGSFTLFTGVDGSGNRPDLVLNSTNLLMQGATIGTTVLSGFRDITLNRTISTTGGVSFSLTADRDIFVNNQLAGLSGNSVFTFTAGRDIGLNANITGTGNGTVTATANRDLTIGTGATITSGSTGSIVLKAAGGVTNATGVLTLNGTLNAGSGAFALSSGLDSSGNAVDLILNNTNLLMQSTVIGTPTITGFRDITMNRDFSSSGSIALTALRNLTIGSGVTIKPGSTSAISLTAANGVAGGLGILTINGILNAGTGSFALFTGVDGSGNRPDLILNSTNLLMQGSTLNSVTLTGFRDLTISRDIISAASTTLSIDRDLILNNQINGQGTNSSLVITAGRDITFNANAISNGTGTITATAGRNLTVNSGATLTSGASGTMLLKAAGGVTTATGILTLNGTISAGSSSLTLTSGVDGSGNAADLTLSSTNFLMQGAVVGTTTISGFRDILLNTNIALNSSGTITANRNLTIGSGKTLTSATTSNLTLNAAGGVAAGTGIFALNGTINMGTGVLTLISGLDGSSNRTDLTLDTASFLMQGATIGAPTITGFRDLTINRSITSSANLSLTAYRNLTIGSGTTLTAGSTSSLTLNAANGGTGSLGLLTINGILNVGTSTLTLTSGVDGSGNRNDLTLNSTNFLMQGASIGTTTISGFNDIFLNRNLTFGGVGTITANRNLTIGSGATITSGAATNLTLRAANNTTTGTGIFTLNGTINMGTATLSIVSGVDGSGNSADLTLNNTNFLMQGATIAAPTISGFRDITFNRSITSSGGFSVTAARNLTIGSGATISGSSITLYAAGSSPSATGILTLNGTLNIGSGNLTLTSGLDGSGNRADITFDNATLLMQGSSFSSLIATGFRDINLNRSLSFSGNTTITSNRNLTIGTGATISAGATQSLTLSANSSTGTGIFTLNGAVSVGTGTLTIVSGLDSSGNRVDLTLNNTNFLMQGSSFGALAFTGFRDITINRDILSNTNIAITANRNLTIGSAATLTASAAGSINLKAANGTVTNIGTLTLNGKINAGTSSLTLTSGVDSLGVAPNLTIDNTNFLMQGSTFGTIAITGFNDIIVNRDITSGGNITINANHNLTLNSTLQSGATWGMVLYAAAGNVNGTGSLLLNGKLIHGTYIFDIKSGLDSSGNRNDLVLNSTNFQMLDPVTGLGNAGIYGFRDITLNTDIITNGGNTIIADRNLTIGSGVTIKSSAIHFSTLQAAGGDTTRLGIFTNNGTISTGAGNLTLTSGVDSSGNRADLILDNSNLVLQGATIATPSITGFQDITINRSLAFSANATISALRNLTIGSGATISSGAATTLVLRAANAAVNGVGLFTLNGTINMGTGALTIISGVDASNNRTDLTLNNTNFLMQGATIGTPTLTGFRDITLNRDILTSGDVAITAFRNLTVGNGVTLASGAAGAITLRAANSVNTDLGILTLNGILKVGTGDFILSSGVDGSGNRPDLILNNTNTLLSGASFGRVGIGGFRDITLDRDMFATGNVSLVAERNLTINSGRTIAPGAIFPASTAILTLKAAGGVITNTGLLTMNGILSAGAGALTLVSGVDSSGNRANLTLDNSNMLMQGSTTGVVNVTGFQDITLNRDILSSGGVLFTAQRNLTVGSGIHITPGASNGLTLQAAGGVSTATGVLTFNGILNAGANVLTLSSGLDSSGNLADLTLDSAHFLMQGSSIGSVSISGFKDISVNRDLTSSGNVTIAADHNLTIASGTTLTTGSASALNLRAGLSTGTGALAINGIINAGTGTFTLTSGNGTDLIFDNAHFLMQGGTVGSVDIFGFRDITLSKDLIASSYATIQANRNLTVGNITTGINSNLVLKAAGASVTNTGILTLNGKLTAGRSSNIFTLLSGLDSSGNRADLILNDSNLDMPNNATGLDITGFRDITLNKNIIATGGITLAAYRNLTLGSGYTLTTGPTGAISLMAANGITTDIGLLTINGNLNIGTGALTLYSGTNSSGIRSDLALNNTNFLMQGSTVGSTDIQGFRDIAINRNYNSTGIIRIIADRNLTIGSGTNMSVGNGNFSLTLRAAGGVTTNVGQLYLNGTLTASSGGFELLSGIDASGNRLDLSLNNTNLLLQTANFGGVRITGFRDIAVNRDIISGSYVDLEAARNLTVQNVKTGNGNSLKLTAADGNINNLGILTINGKLSAGNTNNPMTLLSGIDSSGNRVDLTLNSTNFEAPNNISGVNLTGFRDITLDTDLLLSPSVAAASNSIINAARDIYFNHNITQINSVASTTLLATAGRDIIIGSASNITGGVGTTLVAGRNFINHSGSDALSVSSGRWLVYSSNPETDTADGLPYNFRSFGCTYGGSCNIPGSGNGFVYTQTQADHDFNTIRSEFKDLPKTVEYVSQTPLVTFASAIQILPSGQLRQNNSSYVIDDALSEQLRLNYEEDVLAN